MFDVGGTTVALEFAEGTVLAGATVKCSLDMSIRDFAKMQRMWNAAQDGDMEKIVEAYMMFGDAVLVEWDISKRGEAVPATGEGLSQIPVAAANAIFSAWTDAVGGRSGN